MPQVFISYARKTKKRVEEIVAALENYRIEVWYDAELYGGDDWWETILDEIEKCDAFIYAASFKALKSKFCRAELKYALKLKKPVLPVIVSVEFTEANLPAELHKRHCIDAGNELPAQKIIDSIHHLISQRPQTPSYSGKPRRPPRPRTFRENAVFVLKLGAGVVLALALTALFTIKVLVPAFQDDERAARIETITEVVEDTLTPQATVPVMIATDIPTVRPTCVPLFQTLTADEIATATWQALTFRQTQRVAPTLLPPSATWQAMIDRQTQLAITKTGTPDCIP